MQPKVIVRPGFTVVGMQYHGKNEHQEIPRLWSDFGPRMREVRHVAKPDTAYGVMGNYDATTGEFDYLAGLEVDEPADVAAGMTAQNIPAQTYVVLPCTLTTMRQTYDTFYQSWLPNSTYRHADGPEFELYDEHFDPGDPNSGMYLYIPIVANE